MKILYVDLEREWRGGQSQALLTLKGLLQAGQKVELVAAKGSPLAERSRAAGISLHCVSRLGLRVLAARMISRLVRGGEFELVYLNEPHALSAAWLAKAHKRSPLLLSRRIGFPLRGNRISQARYAAVERFVANSRDVARSLTDSGIAAERICIVNEGVEIPERLAPEARTKARAAWGVRPEEFLFGCASVFTPEKGQRHLVDAMAKILPRFPVAKLLLAGDGKCREAVKGQARRFGIESSVLLLGFVKDVETFYAALDAFVFPSEFEGLGTALQAAMAYGIPSISTARGALAEVVEHKKTALVAEPNGDEFAEAMIQLMENRELRERLGCAGRSEVQRRFSAERMVADTIAVCENVLRTWKSRD
ncbi:MAG TPA: glycosyltransferase family 4 protein [Candidatus Acidoferrum sp.]|nr:glycosyltransferase family 4 protein [Candidatus Acidoferrum sp.]